MDSTNPCSWPEIEGRELALSMGPRHDPPDAIHLVAPLLYACAGTCYCLTGHIAPMVAGLIYYALALAHLAIYMTAQSR